MSQIREIEYTSSQIGTIFSGRIITRSRSSVVETSYNPWMRVDNGKQSYDLFLRNAEKLCPDRVVQENGTLRVTTKSGATLTNKNIVTALRAADELKCLQNQRKEASITVAGNRSSDRRRDREEKTRLRQEREENCLRILKKLWSLRLENEAQIRAIRRNVAKERTNRIIDLERYNFIVKCFK